MAPYRTYEEQLRERISDLELLVTGLRNDVVAERNSHTRTKIISQKLAERIGKLNSPVKWVWNEDAQAEVALFSTYVLSVSSDYWAVERKDAVLASGEADGIEDAKKVASALARGLSILENGIN